MSLPLFFTPALSNQDPLLELDEETSRHISGVLRMQTGEALQLTDGQGRLATVLIDSIAKKRVTVSVSNSETSDPPAHRKCIAVALLKQASRLEWFFEKATELGITDIVPLITQRTERQHFRLERMRSILVSAMLQSHQVWLPILGEPLSFAQAIAKFAPWEIQRFIAHCEAGEKIPLLPALDPDTSQVVFIGPEGDFTVPEIEQALDAGYTPVTLGTTRLRTETAALVAAHSLMIRR